MTNQAIMEQEKTYIDPEMDRFSSETLRQLLMDESKPAVSIFLPMERKGAETQQNAIRLKNAYKAALEQLKETGVGHAESEALLAPMTDLVDNYAFWQKQSDGLAIFLSPQITQIHRLPLNFEEHVAVGDLFYLKPMLPLLTGNGSFYVLALNLGGVQLLHGSRFGFSEVELGEDVPKSLQEELKYDDIETHLQYHTQTGTSQGTNTSAGDRAAMFHGHGVAGEEEDTEQILRFFRSLDNGVRDLLENDSPVPLVLAGISILQGLYRQVNHYDKLAEKGVEQDPETLEHAELHQRAWEIVKPEFMQSEKSASDYYHHLDGNDDERATNAIETIASAAYFQRVDTLFITDNTPIWGNFDSEANKVSVHDEQQADDEDLVNFAAIHTYVNGGAVYVTDTGAFTDEAPIAATLRY